MIFLVWQTYASGQIDVTVNGSSPQVTKYLCRSPLVCGQEELSIGLLSPALMLMHFRAAASPCSRGPCLWIGCVHGYCRVAHHVVLGLVSLRQDHMLGKHQRKKAWTKVIHRFYRYDAQQSPSSWIPFGRNNPQILWAQRPAGFYVRTSS
jgi:hypothetical protein